MKNARNKIVAILIFIVCLLPLVLFSIPIIRGEVAFWYDPARDMLSGWDNLHKLTLIGPPSGIQGIFYGPYWIWLLSLCQLISKNPRVTYLIVETIPYCIIFPLILSKFSKLLSKKSIILIYLFFIINDGWGYAMQLWNINLTPLLLLLLIYFIVFYDFKTKGINKLGIPVLIGVLAALIFNIHMSFGIATLFGLFIFYFLDLILFFCRKKGKRANMLRNKLFNILFVAVGILITFLPFLVFELRHGFLQTQVFIKAFLSFGGIINLKGLNRWQIITLFFGRFGFILHTNWVGAYLLELVGSITFAYLLWKKKINLQEKEKRLIFLLLTLMGSVLFIYLTARNPVWEYHFVGTEVFFLLLIGLIVSKIKIFKILLFFVDVYLVMTMFINFNKMLHSDPYKSSTLLTKEYITKIIGGDAKKEYYTVFSYSSSIYTYDFSYLFRYLLNKDVSYDPGNIEKNSPLVYLIIPNDPKLDKEDFINYRTPNALYKTVKKWQIPDGTEILKRVHPEKIQ